MADPIHFRVTVTNRDAIRAAVAVVAERAANVAAAARELDEAMSSLDRLLGDAQIDVTPAEPETA